MAVTYAEKDRAGTISYTLDWATELGSDTIASAAWELPPALAQVAVANTTTTATIRVSGGTVGSKHRVRCKITGASGQIYPRTLHLRIGRK